MRKTAVGYAIGKLMQVMGLFLLVPLALAIYDNSDLPLGELVMHAEVLGFWLAILIAILIGTQTVVAFKAGRDRQGLLERPR